MCGIAGLFGTVEAPVRSSLLEMLGIIQHRGPDAGGIAVFDRPQPPETAGGGARLRLRVSMSGGSDDAQLAQLCSRWGETAGYCYDGSGSFRFFDGILQLGEVLPVGPEGHGQQPASSLISNGSLEELHRSINLQPGLYIHSLSPVMSVYKDGGAVSTLAGRHGIGESPATHGIGHVRMATESAEDINAAHPFVSHFYQDLAVVHNGQFTNYFNVRRRLEQHGAVFKTSNDSEAASHLIAYRMRCNGGDLDEALAYALEELDGVFCIIAATSNQIGLVKDRLGIKPLLMASCGGMTLLGSEQCEFSPLISSGTVQELDPGEVRTWSL